MAGKKSPRKYDINVYDEKRGFAMKLQLCDIEGQLTDMTDAQIMATSLLAESLGRPDVFDLKDKYEIHIFIKEEEQREQAAC